MHAVTCRASLSSCYVHHGCVLFVSGGDAKSNALIVSFVHMRTHFLNTHTQKKIALVTRVGSS
jgi:hypothetical protein